MASYRSDRLNEEIKKTISEIIRDMKDPRISEITTLTGIEVTSDLKYAKAKVSVYDEDETKRRATIDALNHAAGFIAHELGARMRIRCIPSIRFQLDDSIAYSVHISKILADLHAERKEE